MPPLLPVAEAQARLLALCPALPVEQVAPAAAVHRFAAADIAARRTQPEADLSAMDGYAIRFADLPGPFRVTGEAAAGGPAAPAIARHEAARIFTGAPLPPGADTILVQEEAARQGDRMMLSGEGPGVVGKSVRHRGSDFAEGTVLVPAGIALTPARIALAILGGHGALPVRRRPRIALISTGDELVAPGESGGLPASNAPMLAALLGGECDVTDHPIVRDDLDTLTAVLAEAATRADILVTTGGASIGDHDLVRPALLAAGATLDFWKVAMRPGKPLMAGRLGETLVLGLPGNPVAALVTGLLFVRPAARAMAGAADPLPAAVPAPLARALPGNGVRQDYMRAILTAEGVVQIGPQDSAAVRALAASTHLIVRPPHAPPAAAGEMVPIVAIG